MLYTLDIDSALAKVGGYRRWNMLAFLLLSISSFVATCWQQLVIVFIGWEPYHHCKVNTSLPLNESIPYDDKTDNLDKCHMYDPTEDRDLGTNRSIVECTDGWYYNSEGYETVVTEWDLVCGNNYLAELSQTIYQLGCLIGVLFISYLVDKFGRRNMHVISLMIVCILGVGVGFSQSYIAFVILRTFIGIADFAAVLSGCTLLMELFDSKRRAFAGIGLEFGWVVLYVILPLLGYGIKDWRILQVTISLCSGVWLFYFWVIPESAIWFASYKQYTKAEDVLNKMARYNGVKNIIVKLECKDALLKDGINDLNQNKSGSSSQEVRSEDLLSTEERDTRHVPLRDVLGDPVMRKFIITSGLYWFVNVVVYYGLILSTPLLAGDRFINYLMMAIVEIPAYFITYVVVKRIGRRWPLLVFHIIAGLPLAATAFVPEPSENLDLSWLTITLAVVGKFGISGSFAIIVLYTKEIIPTNIRGTCCGLQAVCGKTGSMIAPLLAYMGKEISWLPNIIFATLSIGAGFLVLLLPETLNKPLPQTLDDVYRIFYNSCKPERRKSNELKSIGNDKV